MLSPSSRNHVSQRYDAIVVGGRAAGASTAMLLARRGLDVLVVERGRRGSDTLSTHALMRAGVLQLRRWGVLERVLAAGTPAITRSVFHYGDAMDTVTIPATAGVGALYAPRRTVLDRVLADAAAEAGATVRFSTRVTDLVRTSEGSVTGVVLRTPEGNHLAAHAPLVVGADGARSLVARSVQAPVTRRAPASSFFAYGYWEDLPTQGYEVSYGPGGSAGLIPTNDGRTAVWVSGPAEHFARYRSDLPGALAEVLATIFPSAAVRMAAARPSREPVRGWAGLPGYMRRPWGPGWALVGDASHFKDPMSSHGITDALRDAELLADAVVTGTGEADLPSALASYERLRDELSVPLFDVVGELAAYRWDLSTVASLQRTLSRATRAEVAHLSALDREPLATAA